MEKKLNNLIERLKKDGYNVEINTIVKNGVRATAVTLMTEENVGINLYIDEVVERLSLDELVVYVRNSFTERLNGNYPKCVGYKDIVNRLSVDNLEACICGKGRAGKGVIVKDFLDLELYIRINLNDIFSHEECLSSTKLTSSLKEESNLKDMDDEELFKIALNNVFKKEHVETIYDYMKRLVRKYYLDGRISEAVYNEQLDILNFQNECSTPMYYLSTRELVDGAVVMCDNKLLKTIADKFDSNLFICPSSIHEVIAVPATDINDADTIREMVKEVNSTGVSPYDFLADSVYYFDREKKELSVA